MYSSSSSVRPTALSGYRWRVRFDWDVLQRCLGVAFLGVMAHWALNAAPMADLGLWMELPFFELWLTAALAAAVLKSAALLPAEGKAVLVTGCDTGFGLALAKHLHELGATVFAGCLLKDSGGKGAAELGGMRSGRMHVLQLDVTKDDDWDRVYDYVEKETGGKLWGLVNNAGWATFGEVEWVPMDTYSKIVDINVFGVIRGVKKMLPLVRRSRGRIVSIASGLARYTVPTRSPYVLSKWALAGFSDVLRHEMEPFGVKVSLLEPGNFVAATNIFNDRFIKQQSDMMWDHMSEEVKSSYGESYFKKRVEIMTGFMEGGITDTNPVIEAYTNALLEVWPQKRYNPMDFAFKLRTFVCTHLPEVFYDSLYVDHVKPAMAIEHEADKS